eukprot:Rmarinus@m.131
MLSLSSRFTAISRLGARGNLRSYHLAAAQHPRQFRDKITSDGSSGFRAEPGRYHMYVCLACPFAHRALITRKLMGLEKVITVSTVHYLLGEEGWKFDFQNKDPLFGSQRLRDVYHKADPEYQGHYTVPVIWDKKRHTIVNNESAEIIEMLSTEFAKYSHRNELYPEHLREEINKLNRWIGRSINMGVYHCGMAKTQEAYEKAYDDLFSALDRAEDILAKNRYLTGENLTLADIRLITTLFRFDPVYVTHFKCNKKRLVDYPNLWGYARELYQMPAIQETVNFPIMKLHYYQSHKQINPSGLVAKGPDVDFTAPHGRDHLPSAVESS